jgi:ERCC4-type nuclease
MKNRFTYLTGLIAIIMATSLMIVVAQEITNATLNNTISNNTIPNNTTIENVDQNISIVNNTVLNGTNEAYFTIGTGIEHNNSTFNIGKPIKPMKDASKLGYIIQSTPHGYV